MPYIFPVGDIHIDVLREVGNIGTGHAATALSQMLNKQIDMQVPRVSMLPFAQITDIVGGAEQVVLAIFLRVEGDAPANMFFIIQPESAKQLLHGLTGVRLSQNENELFSEMALSALAEIGNILAGSYLSSLSDFTHLSMLPSVPAVALDMAGAIIDDGLIQYGEMGDTALLIDTTFLEDHEELQGHFILIPDPDSLAKIFDALGVPLE